jgi:hypothetical protein
MATNSILDADMATVTGWLRSGFSWWTDELRLILPFAFPSREKPIKNYVHYRGDRSLTVHGSGNAECVLVDPDLCLVRRIDLPALSDADLERFVAMDADRIMPIAADLLIINARADPKDNSKVTVAGIRRDSVITMLDALNESGIAPPQRIGLFEPAEPGSISIDFSKGCADAGLIAPIRSVAMRWWAITLFLFALNIGLLVWRDVESVRSAETLVAAQAPAVNATRAITKRISNTKNSAQALAVRRTQQNALAVMAAVTQALPERAWVQRFAWDGKVVRLSGYKREGTDVIGALRKSAYFKDVRAANAEAMAEVPTGQPFDLSAIVRQGAI